MDNSKMKPGYCKTLTELAEAAGISYRSVRDWKNKDGFPVEADGTYSVWAVCEWRFKTFMFNNSAAGGEVGVDPNDLKRRKLAADVALAEMDLMIKEMKRDDIAGVLIDREAAKRWIKTSFTTIRHRLEDAPAEYAAGFPEDVRYQVLSQWKHSNRLILRQLANYMNQTPGIDEEVASVD